MWYLADKQIMLKNVNIFLSYEKQMKKYEILKKPMKISKKTLFLFC
jgi:hypothetical protein